MSAVGVPSGSSGGTWGSITGTLSNQTDLQNALNAKVGITGTESITGLKTFAPTGTITTGLALDFTGATFTNGVLTTGTMPDANAQVHYANITGVNCTNRNHYIHRIGFAGGTYTTGTLVGYYALMNSTNTGNTIGGYSTGMKGTAGSLAFGVAGTSGLGVGHVGIGYGSKTVIGGQFYGVAADGTSPRAWGVFAIATKENSAQAIAVYGKINSATSAAVEATDAGVNAAACFDNGDTTGHLICLKDAGTNRFIVADGGHVTNTLTGSPTTGFTVDGSALTSHTNVMEISNTFGSSGNIRTLTLSVTHGSGSGGGNGLRIAIGGGGTSSGQIRGVYSEITGAVSGATLGWGNSPVGNCSFSSYVTSGGNTSGSAVGFTAHSAGSNKGTGVHGYVSGGVGADARSYGVRGIATTQTGSGTAVAVGVFGKIGTTDGSTLESSDPGVSAGGLFSNGDTTSAIAVFQDDATTVWRILNGGALECATNAALTAPTNAIQLGAVDTGGGNRTLAVGSEQTVATEALTDSTHTWTININNAFYKVMLVSV